VGTIYLVRHGQASFGSDDYDQLSPLGEEQSWHLGQWLSDCGRTLPAVVTGNQKRHLQTATACSAACTAPPRESWRQDSGFNEFDHQEVMDRFRPYLSEKRALDEYLSQSGNPRRAYQQLFSQAVSRWTSGEHDADYRESFLGFRKRVNEALRPLAESPKGAPETWVFTSGGAISAVIQELLAIPDHRIFELNWVLVNTGVTKLLYQPGKISLSFYNSQAHLERLQRPELITYR
jgi:broad specificity phosphatase PhoE